MAKSKSRSKRKPEPALPPWIRAQFRGKSRTAVILLLCEERNARTDQIATMRKEHATILAEQQLQLDALAKQLTAEKALRPAKLQPPELVSLLLKPGQLIFDLRPDGLTRHGLTELVCDAIEATFPGGPIKMRLGLGTAIDAMLQLFDQVVLTQHQFAKLTTFMAQVKPKDYR